MAGLSISFGSLIIENPLWLRIKKVKIAIAKKCQLESIPISKMTCWYLVR